MTSGARFVDLAGSVESRRFVVLYTPPDGQVPSALVVHAPAFAEEMNKARRMVAAQARQLAAEGCMVLVVDPLGSGDSPGDFGEASWADWVDDIRAAAHWLRAEFRRQWPQRPDPPCVLWGLRAGALLAAAAARELGMPCHLLWWQPATLGKLVLNQFLRLLSAGDLLTSKSPGGAAVAARQALASGQPVEVAGYGLSAALARGLEDATLEPPSPPGRLMVLEVGTGGQPSPAVAAALVRWQTAGWTTSAEVVAGPSFWQTTEIEDAPALWQATTQALRSGLAWHQEPTLA